MVLDDIQDIPHFVPEKQGNLFAIFQEQSNWDEDDIGQNMNELGNNFLCRCKLFPL